MSFNSRLGAALFSAVLALITVVCHAGVNNWTIKGPPGGPALGVQAHTTAPHVFYATFQHSLHRSIDGGATWTLLRHFEGQVSSLAIDPSDGDRIYVAVSHEGLYRSENRGDSFTLVAEPQRFGRVVGNPVVGVNATAVYHFTDDHRLYRSLDRGNSWTDQGQAPQLRKKILVDPHNADQLFALSSYHVLNSSDGGATWTQVQVPAAEGDLLKGIAQLSATQLIALTSSGIYVSSNRGASWTQSTTGLYDALAVDSTTPGRAVAMPWFSGYMAETTDYGATWQDTQLWSWGRVEGLAIDSQSSSRYVQIGAGFTRHASNSAQQWSEAIHPPVAQWVTQFATTSTNNNSIYAITDANRGEDIGLFKTSGDNGWQQLQIPGFLSQTRRPAIAVRPDNPDHIYIGSHQRVHRSTDGGQSWPFTNNTFQEQLTVHALAFDPEQTSTLYASVWDRNAPADSSAIHRSTDDGATWTPWSTNLPATVHGFDLQIDPANPSRMYLGASQHTTGSTGGLHHSSDRGITWERTLVGYSIEKVIIDPTNSSRVYAVGSGLLEVSDDGGQTFTTNTSITEAADDRTVSSIVIDPQVPSTLYATTAGPSSYVLRSVDSGVTWEILRAGTGPGPWRGTQLIVDPSTPSLVYVSVPGQGVASLQIAPDLVAHILSHNPRHPRGHESTFILRAVNNGPFAATRVNLSATLPADVTNVSYSVAEGSCSANGCVVPSLQAGEEIDVTVRFMTPATAPSIVISGRVSAHENDTVLTNNTAQVTALTADPGDLSVTVTPSVTSLSQGGNFTYAVTVTNQGDAVSNGGIATFTLHPGFTLGTLPSGCSMYASSARCSLGSIAAGNSQTITFNAVATTAGDVVASVSISTPADIADIDLTNNTAFSWVTAIAPSPPNSGNNNSGGGGSSKGGGGSMNLAALIGGLLLLAGRRRFVVTR